MRRRERFVRSEEMLVLIPGYWILTATGYGPGVWFGWEGDLGSVAGIR